MLDLYSIYKDAGAILDGLTISMVGDLKYGRCIRCLWLCATSTLRSDLYLQRLEDADEYKLFYDKNGIRYSSIRISHRQIDTST